MDFGIWAETGIEYKKAKMDKFLDLVKDIKYLWNMWKNKIPIVALERFFRKRLEELEIKERIGNIPFLI